MDILFIRPDPGNERFGLGPFFRVEPLGVEYIAAALARRGVRSRAVDQRFDRRLDRFLDERPQVVGIAGQHALEFDRVIATAREVRRRLPDAFVVVGGHAVAAYPKPLEIPEVDAVVTGDGEEVMVDLVDALASRRPLSEVAGLRLRTPDGWVSTMAAPRLELPADIQPARHLVDRYRDRYMCVLFRPLWAIETARGCPFRCSFCSITNLFGRSFRHRPIGAVVEDFATSGEHVFVVDDLFWYPAARSLELAQALKKRGIKKRFLLVQSRTDLVARHPELLEAWRPVAEKFDIFFGLEAADAAQLSAMRKDATVDHTVDGIGVARAHDYGVTGNFIIDPTWGEDDFGRLWEFVRVHRLQRSGFTIATPLPGTDEYERVQPALAGIAWERFDMHHLLAEPRLGHERFLGLYAETWRRSVLNARASTRWLKWMREVKVAQIPALLGVLRRTQRLMDKGAYLAEHEARMPPAPSLSSTAH